MNKNTLDKFRELLNEKLAELRQLTENSSESRKAVELDQQVMGRLSRQDALQQQAMAKAQEVRRVSEAARLRKALVRLEADEYGYCAECGEEIALERLKIDISTEYCVGCVSSRK